MFDGAERRKLDQLFHEVAEKGMSRRQMIRRAAVLGISAQALTLGFVGLARDTMAQGGDNPLGVDPEAPLEVVIFDGGYGDEWAQNVNKMYQGLYPDAEIDYTATQRLQEQYQAQVVAGEPPDIMQNSGAGNFNTTNLYTEGQLAALDDLMAAPAYGQEDLTVASSIAPGTQALGVFGGKQYVMKYVLSMYGVWYNQALFDEKGWEYPETWDDMLAMCETIKSETDMAPWTYQGQYPYYMRWAWNQLVYKGGGWPAILKIDNLAEDAWTQDVAVEALQAFQALYDNGYILDGTAGLSHTESQTFWIQGEAVFIPCGSWLENEMADVLEGYPDFELRVKPMPSLTANDKLPFTATQVSGGEDFLVFADGTNVQGGKEYLRLLFSQAAANFFTEATGALTAVQGATEGLELSGATRSVQNAIDNAGDDVFVAQYDTWYADLKEESDNQFGLLLTGQATAEEVSQTLQELTDQIRNNPDIEKFERTAPAVTAATPAASPMASPVS